MVWFTVTTDGVSWGFDADIDRNLFGLFCGEKYISGSCLLLPCASVELRTHRSENKTTATPSHRSSDGAGDQKEHVEAESPILFLFFQLDNDI